MTQPPSLRFLYYLHRVEILVTKTVDRKTLGCVLRVLRTERLLLVGLARKGNWEGVRFKLGW